MNRRSFFGVFAATAAMPLGAALQLEGGEIARCKFGDKVYGTWLNRTDWKPSGTFFIAGRGEVPIEERSGTIDFTHDDYAKGYIAKVREFREIGHEERMANRGSCNGEYSPHGLYIGEDGGDA